VEIPLLKSYKHYKANNDIFSILWHQLRVLVPPLGMLVGVLDGYTVGTTGELLSLLWDARGESATSCVWCKSDTWHHKRSSLWVPRLVSSLLNHEVPTGCASWRLGHFVIINWQNKLNQTIAGIWVYIFLLPAYTSILISSWIKHIASILNYLDIAQLAQNHASLSKIQPIAYPTLYVPSVHYLATCNCIIMLMPLI